MISSQPAHYPRIQFSHDYIYNTAYTCTAIIHFIILPKIHTSGLHQRMTARLLKIIHFIMHAVIYSVHIYKSTSISIKLSVKNPWGHWSPSFTWQTLPLYILVLAIIVQRRVISTSYGVGRRAVVLSWQLVRLVVVANCIRQFGVVDDRCIVVRIGFWFRYWSRYRVRHGDEADEEELREKISDEIFMRACIFISFCGKTRVESKYLSRARL